MVFLGFSWLFLRVSLGFWLAFLMMFSHFGPYCLVPFGDYVFVFLGFLSKSKRTLMTLNAYREAAWPRERPEASERPDLVSR